MPLTVYSIRPESPVRTTMQCFVSVKQCSSFANMYPSLVVRDQCRKLPVALRPSSPDEREDIDMQCDTLQTLLLESSVPRTSSIK
jgi:hypothetical protein